MLTVTPKKSKSKWVKKVRRNRKLPSNANTTSKLYIYFRPKKQSMYVLKEAWVTKINQLWLSLKILSSRKKSDTTLGHDLIINENIEYEESELRLIIYQIAIGILLHLVILAIFISIPILTMEFNPRVVSPEITNQNQFGKWKIHILCSIY